jgi:ATP phosphoribosyltransferase
MRKHFDPRTTIALSDGKSLGENTLGMFVQASMDVGRPHVRSDVAPLQGCPGFLHTVFARADQVPWLVADGWMAAGITGHDQVIEGCVDVETIVSLPFNRATTGSEISCVVFTREDNTLDTLESMRLARRRVVTEYPKEVAAYLRQHGIEADVLACTGKAEMLVRIGFADYGATITETGTSIRVNELKRVRIPEVFRSTTLLVANREMYADPAVREHVDFLGRILKGVLDARGKVLLAVNAPRDCADAVAKYLVDRGATLSGPGIKDIHDKPHLCAIDSVVPIVDLNLIQFDLTRLGATGFIPFVPKTLI